MYRRPHYSRRRGQFTRGQQPSACRPQGRYVAIVAEKPKAGEKIAQALGRPVKCRYNNIPYWVIWVDGTKYIVAPSAGHLFGPHNDARGFPVYTYEWRPLFEFDKNAGYTRKFYRLMEYLLPGAYLYINACDYDIEGSVIGYMIIEAFGDIKRYRRMKFSSLSPIEIRRAFHNLEPPDTSLVEAGKARHEVDWLWGINVSRALMYAVRRATGRRVILSAGRVQSPTIVEAVRRWEEINLSVPLPQFNLTVKLTYSGIEFTARPHGWRPERVSEAKEIAAQLRAEGRLIVSTSKRAESRVRPPPAFNLGDLQKEAARLYKFSPMKTQSIAEDLYLDALISYPRTNSQKLPPTINYKKIIDSLSNLPGYSDLARRLLNETKGILRPVQGPKDDPAHPAIHPTGVPPKKPLDRDHALIYDLIVRRFLAAFSSYATISRTQLILVDSSGREYEARGITVVEEGWFAYYPYAQPSGERIPLLPSGARISIRSVSVRREWVRRVPELSKTSLLTWMEAQRIGTEATRARIIETLFKRRYLEARGNRTVVTELGMMVARVIEELFPDLSKPDLTRKLEAMLEDVRMGKITGREVVGVTVEELDELLKGFREKLEYVGDRLAISLGMKEPPQKCPICGRESTGESPYGLCELHWRALLRLKENLPKIMERLEIDKREALRLVASLRGQAGRWVSEVASYVLQNLSSSLTT
ncbi:MAG: DNA topoisomerase I [Desulfurococcales archaeon]|nr:DNA topoisomerase I [Desulfurococcales archaeon]